MRAAMSCDQGRWAAPRNGLAAMGRSELLPRWKLLGSALGCLAVAHLKSPAQ
jgi:hypothetical protein